MSGKVIPFGNKPMRFTYMIQVDEQSKEEQFICVKRHDADGLSWYYFTTGITSWNKLDDLRNCLNKIETNIRTGKTVIDKEDTQLFAIM